MANTNKNIDYLLFSRHYNRCIQIYETLIPVLIPYQSRFKAVLKPFKSAVRLKTVIHLNNLELDITIPDRAPPDFFRLSEKSTLTC